MTSTFSGINTALRGIEAEQIAMNVTSQNTANASTPGYSRQLVDMQTTDPISDPALQAPGPGQMGTGVQVASITRAHDSFVQQQIIYQNGQQSQLQTQSDTLTNVSQLFNEPNTTTGFGSLLSGYFTAWQALANNPTDTSTQAVVAQSGKNLASGFNTAAASLRTMQQQDDAQVGSFVNQINTITKQIAGLNQQIAGVIAVGQQPNDLKDKQDDLVNQLSQIVGIQATYQANGTVNVSLSGSGALVQGVNSYQLGTAPDATQPQFTAVTLLSEGEQIAVTGGTLGGTIASRDQTIGGQLTALNNLAANIASAVNGLQSTGYGSNGSTGINFFSGTTAASLAVDPQILADNGNIASSSAPNEPGDGSMATKISQLQETPATGQTTTLQAQYNTMITQLGITGQQTQTNLATGGLVLQQLTNQQESVSSVSLNEEASNLLQFQAAYNAATKVLSTMAQTITDMINQLGG
jgi:flagellar hook-associated protein 1 FlgK